MRVSNFLPNLVPKCQNRKRLYIPWIPERFLFILTYQALGKFLGIEVYKLQSWCSMCCQFSPSSPSFHS